MSGAPPSSSTPTPPGAGPALLSNEDQGRLAALAIEFESALVAESRRESDARPSFGDLDKALRDGFRLAWDDLSADAKGALTPWPGHRRNAMAFAAAAWIGERARRDRPSSSGAEEVRWAEQPRGQWALCGLAGPGARLCLRAWRLAADAIASHETRPGLPGGGPIEPLAVADEMSGLEAKIEQARRFAGSVDAPESASAFDAKRTGGLAVMAAEELAKWAETEAESFRQAYRAATGQNLFYDKTDGIAPLAAFVSSCRYIQPFSNSTLARMAVFLGEAARRVWLSKNPGAKIRWRWSGQRQAPSLGACSAGGAESDRGDDWLFFPEERLRDFVDSRQSAKDLLNDIDEMASRLADGDPSGSKVARANKPKSTSRGGPRFFHLFEDVAVGPSLLDARRRLVKRYASDAPDLLIPCLHDPVDGARALCILPMSGVFFENEAELRLQLGDVAAKIPEHTPGGALPDFTLYFTFVEKAMADLVVAMRPPALAGGKMRFEFLEWDLTDERPGPPLSPEKRASATLYDPVARRIKESLFHLQHTGDATKARLLLEEALEMEPTRHSALLAMCQLHLAIGNQIMARGYVQAILQVAPDNVEARLLDARFLLDEERFDDAVARAREVVCDEPECAEAWVVMARAEAIQGRVAMASEYLDRALAIEPGNSEAAMLKTTIAGMEGEI
jgi:hypothetical protein